MDASLAKIVQATFAPLTTKREKPANEPPMNKASAPEFLRDFIP
jgi:hypothetical protein